MPIRVHQEALRLLESLRKGDAAIQSNRWVNKGIHANSSGYLINIRSCIQTVLEEANEQAMRATTSY